MSLKYKPLHEITRADLEALEVNQVSEGRELDYKVVLPGSTDKDKREFLADVCSLANSNGGDLVFGISEDKAKQRVSLVGLEAFNVDDEILKLESRIRDGIQPRIQGIKSHFVTLNNEKTVLILRIPRSWSAPHMVTFGNSSPFYFRDTRGKHPMDVNEIRTAFEQSASFVQRIRNFRAERIDKIKANNTPVELDRGAKIVLHLVPLGAFDTAEKYDLNQFSDTNKYFALTEPIVTQQNSSNSYNFDGFLSFAAPFKKTEGEPATSNSYFQFFREGAVIESVDSDTLNFHISIGQFNNTPAPMPTIPSPSYEERLIEATDRYFRLLKMLGVTTPLFVMISLLDVRGYSLAHERGRSTHYFALNNYKIDRDVLLVPEVLVEKFELSASDVLKPCFDAIWNALGHRQSFNYDAQGKRIINTRN